MKSCKNVESLNNSLACHDDSILFMAKYIQAEKKALLYRHLNPPLEPIPEEKFDDQLIQNIADNKWTKKPTSEINRYTCCCAIQ
jgi:hypothetical protein